MGTNIPNPLSNPLLNPTEELKFHIRETFINYCNYRKGTSRVVGNIEFELLEDYNEYLVYHLKPDPIINSGVINAN